MASYITLSFKKSLFYDKKTLLKIFKSSAAAGLCSWVINIVKFYEIFCVVQPKRVALDKANQELKVAKDKLTNINAKLKVNNLLTIINK